MQKTILTNGRFYSFKKQTAITKTIEIFDGRITKILDNNELDQANVPADTKVINLEQSFVLPGLTDSHIHLLAYGQNLLRLNVAADSLNTCLEKVRKAADETAPGDWIIGHGWDHNLWQGQYGSRHDLDAITQQHPIYLTHKSLHCGWANSAALKLAGITENIADPDNGVIMREQNNEPNGILLESAMNLIASKIPEPDTDQMIAAIKSAQESLNGFGITSVHDFDAWILFDVLQRIRNNQELSLRVMKSIPQPHLRQAIEKKRKSGDGDEWLRIGWLKLFSDGALGPQTAAMLSPYENSTDRGMLSLNKEDILTYGSAALPAGIALAIHAIGDRANREVLSAYQTLQKMGYLNKSALPSRIEHVQIIDPDDLPTFSQVGVAASMQPIHAISDLDMAQAFWGERCNTSYAWKSLIDHQAKLVFGSDAPVETPNPFPGIAAALSRQRLSMKNTDNPAKGWTTQQCLSLHEALQAYCLSPAQIGGHAQRTGRIQSGMAADLVLLPPQFDQLKADQIYDLKPTATMVNGNWVYVNERNDIELY